MKRILILIVFLYSCNSSIDTTEAMSKQVLQFIANNNNDFINNSTPSVDQIIAILDLPKNKDSETLIESMRPILMAEFKGCVEMLRTLKEYEIGGTELEYVQSDLFEGVNSSLRIKYLVDGELDSLGLQVYKLDGWKIMDALRFNYSEEDLYRISTKLNEKQDFITRLKLTESKDVFEGYNVLIDNFPELKNGTLYLDNIQPYVTEGNVETIYYTFINPKTKDSNIFRYFVKSRLFKWVR